MLSRIADSLYWIGRYLERAEYSARILETQLQQLIEDPLTDEETAVASLLSVMGLNPQATADGREMNLALLLDALCFSPTSPASLRFTIRAAREAARGVRETISMDVWEAINVAYLDVNSSGFARRRPMAATAQVRQHCILAAAQVERTMAVGEGAHFFELGRAIERVDMTARLISSAASGETSGSWTNALKASGAHHAFVRTRAVQDTEATAAFLINDREFPYSLVRALRDVEQCLERINPRQNSQVADDASLVIGRNRAMLEFADPHTLTDDLTRRMAELQRDVSKVGFEISDYYLKGLGQASWAQVPPCV